MSLERGLPPDKAGKAWTKPNGNCRWCEGPVQPPRRTFCGPPCIHEWKLRSNAGYLRRCVFERDRGKCAQCGRTDATWEADHILSVVEGGGSCDLSNLQTLCRTCHVAKTADLARRRAESRRAAALAAVELSALTRGALRERPETQNRRKTMSKEPISNVLRTMKRELPVVLTQTELLAKGDSVSTMHAKGVELRIKKKTMTDEISGEIKGIEGAISVLVGQIRTRSERREVSCEEIADYEAEIVNVVRQDTKQVVEVRALMQHERQRPLPLKGIDGGKAKQDPAAAPAAVANDEKSPKAGKRRKDDDEDS